MGLVVWNGDNNFFRSTLTHNLSTLGDLRRGVQGRPEHDRRRAHGRLERRYPAEQHAVR